MKTLVIDCVVPDLGCIPPGRRKLVPERVEALAESMAAIGLLHPIVCIMHGGGDYRVVAGAHRLAAAVRLGWAP